MPIFEFECKQCAARFEKLIRSADIPVMCPSCQSADIRKRISTFSYAGLSSGSDSSHRKCGCSSSCSGAHCSTCSH